MWRLSTNIIDEIYRLGIHRVIGRLLCNVERDWLIKKYNVMLLIVMVQLF